MGGYLTQPPIDRHSWQLSYTRTAHTALTTGSVRAEPGLSHGPVTTSHHHFSPTSDPAQ